MPILTKSRLTEITEIRLGKQRFEALVQEAKTQSRYLASTTVFLSHSHADAALIDRIVVLLRNSGVNVYIDRTDSGLPPTTGMETAARLKAKIREHRKFVLVATDHAIASKWCNWELGYGDGFKFDQHIALLPISENAGHWTGHEYLGIYPYIEERMDTPNFYQVVFPNGRTVPLAQWLRI